MEENYHYIIIGASQAGLSAAQVLRKKDNHASILILSEEPFLPYKRTRLSKCLNETWKPDSYALFPRSWYYENKLDLMMGSKVVSIDSDKKTLTLRKGKELKYNKLLIATGARPYRLEIPGGEYIYYLRNKKDGEMIQEEMSRNSSALIIGTGVEGMELADQFYNAGKRVSLVSSSSRIMENWLDSYLSDQLLNLTKQKEISCHFSSPVLSLEPVEKGFNVHSCRSHHFAEIVLASTGIRANTELVKNLKICDDRGIVINEHMETGVKDIFAAGDVLSLSENFPHGLWHAAEQQGQIAAENMSGNPLTLDETSYRLKTEILGEFFFSQAYCRWKNLKESPVLLKEDNRYLRVFVQSGKVMAALMANMEKIARPLQKLVQQQVPVKVVEDLAIKALDL